MLNEEITLGASDKYTGKLRVLAERGTDTLSLKVESASKKLLVMTGAGVGVGRTEPEEMTIVRDDERALVAIQVTSSAKDVFIVRLDRETSNAVWGKVGVFLFGGQVGWVHYLECR
jgi:hypothetical protein